MALLPSRATCRRRGRVFVNCLGSTKPCRAVSPHGGALCCSADCLALVTTDTVDAAVDCVWTACGQRGASRCTGRERPCGCTPILAPKCSLTWENMMLSLWTGSCFTVDHHVDICLG